VSGSGNRMASGFNSSIDAMSARMSGFMAQMAATAGVTTPFGFLKDSVKVAAGTEKALTEFTTMLGGNAAKAKALMADMIKFAADTPLTLSGVQETTRQLLQVGIAANNIIPTMKMLGDVAGGDQERLNRIAYAFSQIKDAGRLMGQDLLQLINAGFNPLSEISRTSGKSMVQLKADMEKGLITFDMVQGAFKSATSEGGRFNDSMKNSSQTLSGLFSTMTDDIQGVQRSLGNMISEQFHLKDALRGVSNAAKEITTWFGELNSETKGIITVITVLIATVGVLSLTLKAGSIVVGLMTTNLATMTAGIGSALTYLRSWLSISALVTAGTNLLSAAWTLGAVALRAIPWAAAILGAGELITYLSGMHDAMKEFNKEAARSKELDKALSDRTSARSTKEISAATAIEDPAARIAELKRLADISEKEISGKKSSLEAIKKELSDMSGISDELVRSSWVPVIGRGEKLIFDERTAAAATASAALDEEKKKAAALAEELARAEAAAGKIDEARAKSIRDLLDKLTVEAATYGMSADAAEIYKLKLKGATDAELAAATGALKFLEATKKAADLRKDIDELTKSLKLEVETFGMSSEEKKLYELATRGASDADLTAARTLLGVKNALEEHQKLYERGVDILRQYMTPQQKLEEQTKELDQLLASGIYTQEQYNFALGKAQEEFNKTAEEANKAKDSVQALDAALMGGAEAQRRITAYTELLATSNATAAKANLANSPAPLLGAQNNGQQQVVNVLLGIAGILGKIEGKPGLVVAPAEVE
jgi:tape measure domain-containing protein